YRINGQGTQNIACLCKQIKAKLIYTSTDYVFDGSKGGAYREDDLPNPLNIYGRSKLEGEKAVAREIEEYLIVRTSWLFGAGGKNFVDTIIDKAGKGEQLRVVTDQVGSPTSTRSLAEALDKLIEHTVQKNRSDAYGIYHVTNSGTCSWFEFAKEIVNLSEIKADISPVTSEEFARSAQRPAISILDNSLYNEITGHSLCSWQEALKQYIIKKRGEA
ncbi:MAG: dTDP-4-dehydrorhamnose reductase, partial [Candidatus Omnitrophica bacterium]|nr:dTDP-4-dehydrorhamnose reductase [Candidatus Omnitrophota bacterium]